MRAPEVVVEIKSAKNLKNLLFGGKPLKPYVGVFVDPKTKRFTDKDNEGDTSPVWREESIVVPFTTRIKDAFLRFEVYSPKDEEAVDVLIGSAKIALKRIVDDVGIGQKSNWSLPLKCPSGPPQGTIDVNLMVRGNPYLAPGGFDDPPSVISQTPRAPSRYLEAPPPPSWAAYHAVSAHGALPAPVFLGANGYPTFNPQAPAPYTAATPPLMWYQYTTLPLYSYGQTSNMQLPYQQQIYGGQAGGRLLNHLATANTVHQFAENFLGGLGFDGPEDAGDTSTGYRSDLWKNLPNNA